MEMDGAHTVALAGLLLLPVVAVGALAALRTLAAQRGGVFDSVQQRIDASSRTVRGVSLLLLATALMHLALAPGHLPGEDHSLTGTLFVLDGLALTAAALLPFSGRSWRVPVATLLVANLLAYALYLGAGWERPDGIGVLAKVVEYAALMGTVLPAAARLRRAARRPLPG